MGFCLRTKKNLSELDVGLRGIGCLMQGNYIKGHIQDPICYACILRQLKYFWNSCMKEYVEVIWEEGHWHTKPSLKDIGGQTCRNKY